LVTFYTATKMSSILLFPGVVVTIVETNPKTIP
jgi:hypothetical protein